MKNYLVKMRDAGVTSALVVIADARVGGGKIVNLWFNKGQSLMLPRIRNTICSEDSGKAVLWSELGTMTNWSFVCTG